MERTVAVPESDWISVESRNGEKISQRRELWRSCVDVCVGTDSLFKGSCHNLHHVRTIQPLFLDPVGREDLL